MQSIGKQQASRLKSVLVGDKTQDNTRVKEVLKSELVCVLEEYLCLVGESEMNIAMNQSGELLISLSAKASRVKNFGVMSSSF